MKHVNMANAITMIRIIGTLLLIFTQPFSALFFVIYTISGLSDVFDGYIARKMETSSAFGAMLDSIADLVLYAVMVLKIFPALWDTLPMGIWYAVTVIVIIRIVSYLFVAVKYKRFASLHTKLNKVTGFAVFMIPYMIMAKPVAVAYCATACSISAISTIQEISIHMKSTEYEGKEK